MKNAKQSLHRMKSNELSTICLFRHVVDLFIEKAPLDNVKRKAFEKYSTRHCRENGPP